MTSIDAIEVGNPMIISGRIRRMGRRGRSILILIHNLQVKDGGYDDRDNEDDAPTTTEYKVTDCGNLSHFVKSVETETSLFTTNTNTNG